ncbi:hypothetical protein GCM10007205_13540 [Oxalicibacterium flavum]|uniref:DUF11 domain-containing protein n=1 Tax=Oxalicibacterium flavum TaxID=179467 RepID=A0A8J2XXY7_9BURK|nr:SdrD B-like domain-containing protein [Oxalicibacterium flavum]GGC05690.1 hypothetical protein GCM10007205_13540 [Oxalicibacterium flavum]
MGAVLSILGTLPLAATAADFGVTDFQSDPGIIPNNGIATLSVKVARFTGSGPVVVTLPIPTVVQLEGAVPGNCSKTGTAGVDEMLTCTVDPAANITPETLSWTVRGRLAGANTTTASVPADDNTGNDTQLMAVTVVTGGDLRVSKVAHPTGTPAPTDYATPISVAGASLLSYTLRPEIATGDSLPANATLRVTDNLPDDSLFQYIGTTAPGWSCARAGNVLTCDLNGPRAVGDLPPIEVRGKVVGAGTGDFDNNAHILPQPPNSENYQDSDPGTIGSGNIKVVVTPGADLEAGIEFPGNIPTGVEQDLIIRMSNHGPSAVDGGKVRTTIPAGFTLGTLPAGCVNLGAGTVGTTPGTVVECTSGLVTSGSNQQWPIPVTTPTVAGNTTLYAQTTPPPGITDPIESNNLDSTAVNIEPPYADLGLTKNKTPALVEAGQNMSSSIVVRNHGIADAVYSAAGGSTPLRVVDDMANAEEFVSGSAGWTCVDQGADSAGAGRRRVVCERTEGGTLAVDATLTLTLTTRASATLTDLTVLANTACTGSTALSRLGLTSANGPQPADPADGTTEAADCDDGSASATNKRAVITIDKQGSGDNASWSDMTTLAATDKDMYFRIQVENTGGDTVPTLNVRDSIPNYQAAVAADPATGRPARPATTVTAEIAGGAGAEESCSISAGNVNCVLKNVAAAQTRTIIIRLQRPFGAAASITNRANVTSPDAILGAGSKLNDDTRFAVGHVVDVALVSKSVNPDPVMTNMPATFTISTRNYGPNTADDVVMRDVLDKDKYEFVSATWGPSNTDCTVNETPTAYEIACGNTTLTPNSFFTSAITVRPKTGNPYGRTDANTASVSTSSCEMANASAIACASEPADEAIRNNTRTVEFEVVAPQVDTLVKKNNVDDLIAYGDRLRYLIRAQNKGPSRAEGIVLTDVLTAAPGFAMQFVAVSGVNAAAAEANFTLDESKDATVTCMQAAANANVVCRLSNVAADNYLDANSEVNFVVEFTALSQSGTPPTGPTSFGNTITITPDEYGNYEPDKGNNAASANSTVLPATDLGVIKETGTPSPADIAQPIRFDIKVYNAGTSDTTKLRIVDTLPTGFEWINTGAHAPHIVGSGSTTVSAPGGNLTVVGSVPANGTDNVCFVSNGVGSVTTLAQRQEITCDIAGLFRVGSASSNSATVTLYARAKPRLYDGSTNAPFLTDRINNVRVEPGKDSSGNDVSIDRNPANDADTSVVQIRDASLSGRVFVDLNNDGDQNGETETADQGIGGVTLRLTGTDKYGNAVDITTTTSNAAPGSGSLRGDYLFAGLAPSDAAGYTITQTQPTGFGNGNPQPNVARTVRNGSSTNVHPAASSYAVSNTDTTSVIGGIVVDGGGNGVQFDFPELTTASSSNLKISGYVYLDADNDGSKDAGEKPLAGVSMTLIGCHAGVDDVVNTAAVGAAPPAVCSGDDVVVTLTVQTDANGFYSFPLDKPGRYTVIQATQPVSEGVATLRGKTTPGTVELVGGASGGGTPGTATTVIGETGSSAPSSISNILISDSTAQSINNNFGEVLPASIGGIVYTEKGTAGSNYQSGTDWPFAGVTVTLTGTNDLGQSVTMTTITGSDGSYRFEGLRPSNSAGYVVTKTNPSRPADPVQNENPGSYPGGETGANVTGSNPGTRTNANVVGGVVVVSGSIITQTNFAVLNGTRVELALAKRHIGDVIVGQQATYELTVTNRGDSPTFGALQLADTLPPGMSLIATDPITSAMGTISNMVVSGQTVRFDFLPTNPIAATGGTAVLQVHVDVAALAQGEAVINYATVTGGGDPYVPPGTPGPGCTDQHCAQDEVKVFGPPVLALAKTGPATLILGNTDEYTLTITNSGEAATIGTLNLIEHLPPGLDLDPANPLASSDGVISNVVRTGDIANGVIVTFDFAPTTPLAPANGTADVRVPVTVDVTTPIGVSTNYASVGGGGDTRGDPPTPGSNCTDTRCANVPANVEGAGLLSIVKTANKREAELGDMVSYTLEISNISRAMVVRPNIVDRLPQGFRLIDDTSRVRGATLLEMKGAPGPAITYSLDQIAPGAKVTITYRVRLGVGGMQGDGVNRASAECPLNPNTKCSNEARWRVKVSGGVFTDDACIVGMVYVDCNGNQIKDHEELGVPGVRLYAENGLFLISDSEGKYSYCGFSPKTHVLKVDSTTLPRGSRLVVSSNRNVGDANSLFLDLKKGELQRADFIEGSCSNTVLEQVKARRTQGEISAPHVEKKGGVGFTFEGKAPNYPQQGTDSANQVIVKPRMDSREAIEKALPAETVSERDTPVRQLEINQGGRDAR